MSSSTSLPVESNQPVNPKVAKPRVEKVKPTSAPPAKILKPGAFSI